MANATASKNGQAQDSTQLRDDLNALREDLGSIRQDMRAITDDVVTIGKSSVETAATAAQDTCNQTIKSASIQTKRLVRERPVATLAGAFVAGAVISKLVCRK